MRIGFVVFPETPEEYWRFVKENGFDHLEIDTANQKQRLETFNKERIKKLKETASSLGVTLSVHASYTLNPAEMLFV